MDEQGRTSEQLAAKATAAVSRGQPPAQLTAIRVTADRAGQPASGPLDGGQVPLLSRWLGEQPALARPEGKQTLNSFFRYNMLRWPA